MLFEKVFSYDFSLESEDFPDVKKIADDLVGDISTSYIYGHVGDGNIHLKTICKAKDFDEV